MNPALSLCFKILMFQLAIADYIYYISKRTTVIDIHILSILFQIGKNNYLKHHVWLVTGDYNIHARNPFKDVKFLTIIR